MPVVVFKCPNVTCNRYEIEYDEMHDIKEKEYISVCKECGFESKRVWMDSLPVIQFVGNDFHINDYDKNGRK